LKIKVLEKNVTEQAKYDFSKCKGISESSLSLITRVQKCDKDLKTCNYNFSSETSKVKTCNDAKNELMANLSEAKDLAEDLNDTISVRDERINELESKLKASEDEVKILADDYASKLAELQSTVDLMQSDFDAIGICRNASEDTNCSGIIESYLCLPRILTSELCSVRDDTRLDLFELPNCLLLGDGVLIDINWPAFVEKNPMTSLILLAFFVLGFWGLLCFAALSAYCCWRCHKARTTQFDEEGSIITTSPKLSRKWGTLTRTTRSCTLDKLGSETDAVQLQSFKSIGIF
jgi:hypothetical protein